MRHHALTFVLAVVAPLTAIAGPIPADGITPQEMADLMQAQGYRAALEKTKDGTSVIRSGASGVNFSIYFHGCTSAGRCGDVEINAFWSNINIPQERVMQWNADQRFISSFVTQGKLVAEWDVVVKSTSTEMLADVLSRWSSGMGNFKKYMNL